MSTVFAIDPGPAKCGAAVVRCVDGWTEVVKAGHIERDKLSGWLAESSKCGHILAIEQLAGYAYAPTRVAHLIETARMEGWIMGRWAGGLPFVVPASKWRGELCGSPTAGDEQVRIVVEALARSVPKLGYRERPHVLDAIGLGIAVLSRLTQVRTSLPPEAARALLLRQHVEKAARRRKPSRVPAVLLEAAKRRKAAR